MKNKFKFLLNSLVFLLLFFLNFQLSASAQSGSFTYQGRVTDNGTNFTGIGLFKFALVTSTNFNHQATATANLGGVSPNYFVSGSTLKNGGSGYVTTPTVTISGGGGSGATALATITGGIVTAVNTITPGSGYTSVPTITIAPPPANISYTTYWSNDGSSSAGSEPTAAISAEVTSGLFAVVLGDATVANMTAIDASLFTQPDLQLRIWFNDGVNGFAALNPLQNLTPTPYSIQALNAGSASNLLGNLPVSQLSGTLTSSQLPNTVLTNNAINVTLNGTFGGDGSGLLNTVTSDNWVFGVNAAVNQTVTTPDVFSKVTFPSLSMDGWTYSSATGDFTCGQTGTYLIQYNAEVYTTANASTSISLRAINDTTGFEILGSQSSVLLPTSNQIMAISKSFIIFFVAGNALQFQFTGSNTSAELIAGNGDGSYQPCFTCTIIRIR
jgi:hypothetical protein